MTHRLIPGTGEPFNDPLPAEGLLATTGDTHFRLGSNPVGLHWWSAYRIAEGVMFVHGFGWWRERWVMPAEDGKSALRRLFASTQLTDEGRRFVQGDS